MGKLSESKLDLDKIFEDYNENHAEQAPEEIRTAYKNLCFAFDEYVSAVTDYEWKCGFRHAMKLVGKEVPT